MSWTCEEEEEEEDPWFTFWVPGTPLVCFQWLPPSPFAPPTLLTSANTPLTLPPPPPKFSGNSFSRPHHPFFLSTTHPLLSPFGIPSKLLPSQQTFPLLPFFLALPPPDCCKCPQDCGSFSSPLLQTHTSFSDSGLANSLSLSFSLSPPLSLWLSLPLSPGSKIFTAAAAVRSHGHKTLWANRGAVNVWSRWCTFHLRSNTGPIDPDVVKTETAYWASPHASTNQTLTKHTQAQH